MKKSLIYLLFAAFVITFVSCDCDEANEHHNKDLGSVNLEAEKLKVSDLLDRLAQATESGDIESIGEIWCPKPQSLLLGTENDEKLMGWSEIKAAISGQSNEFSDILIAITDQTIRMDADGRTAWFFEELNYSFIYNNKAMTFEGIRFTGVLVKNAEKEWKLVQGHMSVSTSIEID